MVGPALAKHEKCGCFHEVEHDGISLLLSPRPKGGFLIYINRSGPLLEEKGERAVVARLRSMLANNSAKWPKFDSWNSLQFSVNPESSRPFMIGRRQKHDYTLRLWMTRKQAQELLDLCEQHAR